MQPWTHRAATFVVTAIFALAAGSLALGTAHAAIEDYAEGSSAGGTCADSGNALTDNNARATCDDGEFVLLTGFDLIDVVPIGAEDISFTIRVAARVTNNDGTDVVRTSLSWNGGSNFTSSTASASINAEAGSDSIVTAPSSGACSNFGRTWFYTDLVNGAFIVRVAADPSSGAQDIQIDDVDVRACWAGRDVQQVRVNGASSVEVDPGNSVSIRVDTLHTDVSGISNSSANDWESTFWVIGSNTQCVNHSDFTNTGTNNVTFSANAPVAHGVYDVLITAFEDDACSTDSSAIFVLNNAVDTTNGILPPTGIHPYIEGNSGVGTCANPVNAVTDNNSRAVCDDGEYVTLAGFDLDQLVPTTAKDISFSVRVAARTSDNDGADVGRVTLSWNGGGNFTTVHKTASIEAESGADSVVYAHETGACSLFGRLWTRAELTGANFRVRVEANPSDANEQISIDDVDVRACWAGRDVQQVRVDGATSTSVNPGNSVDVTVNVLHIDAPCVSNASASDWQSTRWLHSGGSACVNHADFTDSNVDSVSFSIPSPNASGVYDLHIAAFENDSCGVGTSENFVLSNAIDTTGSSPPSSGAHSYAEGSSSTGTCLNPVYAVVDDGNRAICDDGEYVTLSGFHLDGVVPANAEDISFTVRVAARASDNDGSDVARASLSWNGGANFTAAQATASIEAESGSDSIVTAPSGGACNTYGRTWSRSQLTDANFRVRVQVDPTDTNETISIDDVDVLVCWAGRDVQRIRVDGSSSTDVNTGDDVEVRVDALHLDAPGVSNSSANDWESTRWLLGSDSGCVNHADFTDSDTDRLTFSVPAPDTTGQFDLTIVVYRDDSCGSGASAPSVLQNAVDTRTGRGDPSFSCENISSDAKFLLLLWRDVPGIRKHLENGNIPPGLRKAFAGNHRGWDWDNWDCDDDDDDDHRRPGRRHHDDDDDDDHDDHDDD